MRRLEGWGRLPRWPGIVGLTADVSAEFQEYATKLATDRGLRRAELNLILWRSES